MNRFPGAEACDHLGCYALKFGPVRAVAGPHRQADHHRGNVACTRTRFPRWQPAGEIPRDRLVNRTPAFGKVMGDGCVSRAGPHQPGRHHAAGFALRSGDGSHGTAQDVGGAIGGAAGAPEPVQCAGQGGIAVQRLSVLPGLATESGRKARGRNPNRDHPLARACWTVPSCEDGQLRYQSLYVC